MSVFKRSGSKFYQFDFIFEGRRYRGSTKHANKKAAEKHEDILKGKLASTRSGIVEHAPAPLFKQFADEFLERQKREIDPASLSRYKDSLKPLRDKFDAKRLDEITADEIERYKHWRLQQRGERTKRELSPSTVNRDLACLRRILSFAVQTDRLTGTPFMARKVRFLKENGRERILTFDEERKYLNAATPLLRDFTTIILEAGLRPEEVSAIRREDVHLFAAPPYVHIPAGKTKNARRDVPVTKKAKEVLARRSAAAKGEYIFPLRVGTGHDWTQPMREIHPAHYAALKASKVQPRFQVYDLRHTYGTRAIEGGTDPLTLMKLMGHADLKTTSRYVHLSKRHLAEAQKKIERFRVERELAEAEAQKNTTDTMQ